LSDGRKKEIYRDVRFFTEPFILFCHKEIPYPTNMTCEIQINMYLM